MADADKRIDLTVPLLSVRRHGGGAGGEGNGVRTGRLDATAGGVPFGWEHRPGHPKSVRTRRALPPPATAREEKAVVAVAAPVREEARFSDALSLADSCLTVNCSSVTGLSDFGPPRMEPVAARRGGGSVMMDRFLPAAHAVAVCSPQCSSRKNSTAATGAAARKGHGDRLLRLLPPQHSPSQTNHALCIVPNEKSYAAAAAAADDDDEWDAHCTRGFASRRCGLLPTRCIKTTFLLLNPAPAAMRRRGEGWRRQRGVPLLPKIGGSQSATGSLVGSTRNGQHLGHDPIAQSWEQVYINSLLRSGSSGGRKELDTMVAPELDMTGRELYTDQGVRRDQSKANSQLGFLLVLERNDDCRCSPVKGFPVSGGEPKLLPPHQITRPATVINGGKKARRDAAGYGWPLLLEEGVMAATRRDTVPLLLPLQLPSPSESWLSRALPSVTNKPPATSFLGLHVQQHKKQAPSPWCSSVPAAKLVDDHLARPRQIRIHDLRKS